MMSSIRDSKRRAAAPREERRSDPGVARPARGPVRSDGTAGGNEPLLTTANKILVAAHVMDEDRESFTAEDLIVRAWQLYPESFGLSGYREVYPDSNRVLSKLMGSVGLCSRGWLEQVSTKTYRMTVAGRKLAQSLRTGQPATEPGEAATPPARPARVARAVEPERTREVPRIVAREPRENNVVEARPAPRVEAPTERVERVERAEKPEKAERISRPSPERTERTERTERPGHAERVERLAERVAERAAERAAEAKSAASRPTPVPVVAAPKPAPVPAPAPVMATPKPEAPKTEEPRPVVRAADGSVKFEATAALQRLVTSVAGQKFTRGGLVTWQDACQFWSITSAIHPVHLASRLEEIEGLLQKAEATIQATGAGIKIHDRLEVSLTTVIGLQGLHRMLTQRYQRELDAIRARGEE